jgi:hypothetical protein
MKGTICLAALALVLCVQSVSHAADQIAGTVDASGWDLQPPYDRFAAPPPVGLRYTSAGIPYRFAGVDASGGGGGGRRGCNCGPCGAGGGGAVSPICIDWALLPWFATWNFHPRQQGQACGAENWGFGF